MVEGCVSCKPQRHKGKIAERRYQKRGHGTVNNEPRRGKGVPMYTTKTTKGGGGRETKEIVPFADSCLERKSRRGFRECHAWRKGYKRIFSVGFPDTPALKLG